MSDSLPPILFLAFVNALSERRAIIERCEKQLNELISLRAELDETNTGILALYKELDDKRSELSQRNEELSHALDELEEKRRAVLEASRQKSEFLANMSHEIRTPLNAIIGMTEMLLQTTEDERTRQLLRVVFDAGQNLLLLIGDVLDLSKIEAGKLVLENVDFDLRDTINNCLILFEKQAAEKRLQLQTKIDTNLPGSINGDPARLRQVLVNLIGNAIKFTDKGSITVSAMLENKPGTTGNGGLLVRVSVVDTGVGLTPEQMARLFQPFVQADGSTTRKYGGSGLGLSICKRLIDAMGGEIGVDSLPDKGSNFWFAIPCLQGAEIRADSGTARKPSRLKNLLKDRGKVLLVEDHPANRMLADLQLQQLGVQHQSVCNGKEAVEAVRAAKFDIVLMDCHMPEMDGFEATRAIRQLQDAAHLPVVAMTASAMAGDREACIAAGMNDYVTKPIKLEDLYQVLNKWLPGGTATFTSSNGDIENTACQADYLVTEFNSALAGLKQEYGDLMDSEGVRKFFDLFFNDANQTLPIIDAALASRQQEVLKKAFHKLYGAAGTMKLSKLVALSKALETAATEADWQKIDHGSQELHRYVQGLRQLYSKAEAI